MGIAIAIVVVIALAVVALLVTARSRATTGSVSRETRKRDEAAGGSAVPEAAAPVNETTVAEEKHSNPFLSEEA